MVDVRDPRHPEPVNFDRVHPRSWSLHFQTFGDLLLVAEEFNFIAHQPKAKWRDADCSAGLRVYDIADPANPRAIGFMPVAGLGLHRIWWSGERYAYASALLDGFTDHIFICIDMAVPTRPVEVGRWWIPGMWQAGPETNDWTDRVALHHPVIAHGYAYGAWRGGGTVILHVSSLAPLNSSPSAISVLLSVDRRTRRCRCPSVIRGAVADEAMSDISVEPQKYIWLMDVRHQANPVTIATMPLPAERDFVRQGGTFRTA